MAVTSSHGFECGACGTTDTGWDDYAGALRAEVTHLERCSDPDAPECLADARERLAEITGGGGG